MKLNLVEENEQLSAAYVKKVRFKSGTISFLLPQQQSCTNLVLAHLERGNKVCMCVSIFVCVCLCVCLCVKRAHPISFCRGNAKVSLSLWNHKPGHSIVPPFLLLCQPLSFSLSLSLSLSRLLFLSQSLHFSPGITKFSSLYFHSSFEAQEM